MANPTAAGRAADAIDPLTGLLSRPGFSRAVDQADRDRDRMVVVVVTVEGLAEANRLCGPGAGDDLLRSVGRVLALRASVDVTPARLGGNQFGVLWAPADDHRQAGIIDPLQHDVDRAIRDWADELASLGTPTPVTPLALIGVAAGHDGETWDRAELALDLTIADPTGPAVTRFDPGDPRVADHHRRQRVLAELAAAVDHDRVVTAVGPVDDLRRPEGDRSGRSRWLRLHLHLAAGGRAADDLPRSRVKPADVAAAPGLAREIDRRLLDRAGDLLSGHDPLDGGSVTDDPDLPTRVSVPLFGPLVGRRSALDDRRAWPPGVVVEIGQARLAALSDSAGAELAQRLTDLGWELAIAGFDGGLTAWRTADGLAASHLLPPPELLVAHSRPQPGSAELLASLTGSAAATGRLVVAEAVDGSDDELRRLGVDAVIR